MTVAKRKPFGKRYIGQYVAVEDFDSSKVIVAGDDPVTIHTLAREKGFDDPVLFYVRDRSKPKED